MHPNTQTPLDEEFLISPASPTGPVKPSLTHSLISHPWLFRSPNQHSNISYQHVFDLGKLQFPDVLFAFCTLQMHPSLQLCHCFPTSANQPLFSLFSLLDNSFKVLGEEKPPPKKEKLSKAWRHFCFLCVSSRKEIKGIRFQGIPGSELPAPCPSCGKVPKLP